MSHTFEFFIDGPPVSQQTRRREQLRRWREDVHRAAVTAWGNQAFFPGPVLVAITYFYDEVLIDLDNLPRPILDAMKGLIFEDDAHVTDLWIRKRKLIGILRAQSASEALLARLALSGEFVHMMVTQAPNQEIL